MEMNSTSMAQQTAQLQYFETTLCSWIIMTIHYLLSLIVKCMQLCSHFQFSHSYFVFCACFSVSSDDNKTDSKPVENETETNVDHEEISVSREEVEKVLSMMNLVYNVDDHDEQQLKHNDFAVLFEEEEPSFEEVKQAFCVFDHNDDGYVDANDLQIVLPKLGFVEKLHVDVCHEMIRIYDQNHDGRLNFVEFARLMEISLGST